MTGLTTAIEENKSHIFPLNVSCTFTIQGNTSLSRKNRSKHFILILTSSLIHTIIACDNSESSIVMMAAVLLSASLKNKFSARINVVCCPLLLCLIGVYLKSVPKGNFWGFFPSFFFLFLSFLFLFLFYLLIFSPFFFFFSLYFFFFLSFFFPHLFPLI